MAQVLDIQERVVTGQVLAARHRGEGDVRVPTGAVITPSGWDYLRYHRLRLLHGPSAPPAASPTPATQRAAAPAPGTTAAIAEVLPPGFESGVLSTGRYDHPDRNYGCRTEEFGSGFVEPASCDGCPVQATAAPAGGGACGCGGCNKEKAGAAGDVDEALVQRLTDEIMKRLSS